MMNEENIIAGFFKVGFDPSLSEQDFVEIANTFKSYLWGDNGLFDPLKKLRYKDYGEDVKRILFQFYVKPTSNEKHKLKEVENYRAHERSIAVSIVVDDDNFFNKSNDERYAFLKRAILNKLDMLVEVIKRKKLDTEVEFIKADVQKLLNAE